MTDMTENASDAVTSEAVPITGTQDAPAADEPTHNGEDYHRLPFDQRRSTVLDLLRDYRAGDLTWQHVLDTLSRFTFRQPTPRPGSPVAGDPGFGEWYADAEDSASLPAEPDTWRQVDEAMWAGLISPDEYDALLAAVTERHGGGKPAPADDETAEPAPDAAPAETGADAGGPQPE